METTFIYDLGFLYLVYIIIYGLLFLICSSKFFGWIPLVFELEPSALVCIGPVGLGLLSHWLTGLMRLEGAF